MITELGIYKNLSNEDYHASKGLSNSQMTYLLPPHSPKMFWYHHISGKAVKKPTEAYDVGTAVHTLVFEQNTFRDRFHCVNEIPKRTSSLGKGAYDAMERTAAGRIILDKADQELVFDMAHAITSHSMWKSVKGDKSGCVEDSLAWVDKSSGVLLRSRPDYYNDEIIIDLKTTKDSAPYAFQKAIVDYAYHRQAALSTTGLSTLTGREYKNVVLFVVDKNPPHLVRCYVLSDAAIEQGRIEYEYAARKYRECVNTGIWPGPSEVIEDIDLPAWAYRSFENAL